MKPLSHTSSHNPDLPVFFHKFTSHISRHFTQQIFYCDVFMPSDVTEIVLARYADAFFWGKVGMDGINYENNKMLQSLHLEFIHSEFHLAYMKLLMCLILLFMRNSKLRQCGHETFRFSSLCRI